MFVYQSVPQHRAASKAILRKLVVPGTRIYKILPNPIYRNLHQSKIHHQSKIREAYLTLIISFIFILWPIYTSCYLGSRFHLVYAYFMRMKNTYPKLVLMTPTSSALLFINICLRYNNSRQAVSKVFRRPKTPTPGQATQLLQTYFYLSMFV